MGIGSWQPLWLGADDRRLYAAMHAATGACPSLGVVFVPPLLHEQPRSRRFMTEVASGLAAQGMPCLRFDFFGSGDSAGSGDAVDFASMHRDIDVAVAALRARTGVDRIALFAWRAGALPAWSWSQRQQVDLLVLWEPIVDGGRWLSELEQSDASEREQRPRARPGLRRIDTSGDGQLMGCAASARLRHELAGSRLAAAGLAADIRHPPVWVVARGDVPGLQFGADRMLPLPADAPTFDSGDMEAPFFMSPQLERVVDELGRALLKTRTQLEPSCQ